MAAAKYANCFEPFDPSLENFEVYVERYELYFKASGNEEATQIPNFLTSIGRETYTLLRGLTTPVAPSAKTFDDLVKLLKAHFNPTPNVTAERYRFSLRNHREGETYSDFIADLRKLSMHCNFAANLEDRLKDRIVAGIKNKAILDKFMQEADLKYAKAVEIITNWEATTRDVGDILKPSSHVPE